MISHWQTRMQAVQEPIIPIIAQLIRDHPGTISLGQGVVSYGPPPDVYTAMAEFEQQPDRHLYQAVQGIPRLRAAIATKLRQENHLVLDENQVIVTAGSNMGFMHAILAITEPGDQILLQTPYYFNHEMAVRMAGCEPILVPTTATYQLDLEAIAAAITPRTRAIVTISPNNPTGAVYPAVDLQAVNQLCGDRALYHISDEAYEYFTYGASVHCSPAQFDPGSCHTLSLFSLSKAYGFASWRMGYLVIPQPLQGAIQKIQDTILICPPVICQYAALGALRAGKAYCAPQVHRLAQVRQTVLARLETLGDRITLPPTTGAFYVFLQLQQAMDPLALATRLIEEHRVAVIPGNAFGVDYPCGVRVAYGALDNQTVTAGIERLVKGLSY